MTKQGVHKLIKAEFLKPGSDLQRARGPTKNIRRVLQELARTDLSDHDGKILCQAMQFKDREKTKELTQYREAASVGTGVHQWCTKHEKEQVTECFLEKGPPFDPPAHVVQTKEGGGLAKKKRRVKLQATLPPHLLTHL